MSSKSNDQGRAFEYACIMELKDRIADKRSVTVDEESVMAARRAWETQNVAEQHTYLRAADAFIDTLFSAEPLILECDGTDDIVVLSINKDSDAEGGDVRDIVITRKTIRWDIGLSMKHNHFAAKHSVLALKSTLEQSGMVCPVMTAIGMLLNRYLQGYSLSKKKM